MNQPPNTPPGYGPPNTPPGYGQGPGQQHPGQQPASGPMPHSGSAHPHPPHSGSYHNPQNFRGMTRQMFNPASYRQNASGSWAASSLIMSIVSFFFCLGMLAPISLVLGLVGMIGKKRAKGLAFAGFAFSAVQVVGWVLILSLGLWVVFQADTHARQAGAPVVAAVAEFKADHDRVPHNLDELVALGYLPQRWNHGFDSLSGPVRDTVQGKRWSDFLMYMPGRDETWTGDGWSETIEGGRVALDDWFSQLSGDEAEERSFRTYGLVFTGVDTGVGTSRTAVSQSSSFDLMTLWGADQNTREIAQKRRELQVLASRLGENLENYTTALENARRDLGNSEQELKELIAERDLNSPEAVRGDNRARGLLQLIGRERQRVALADRRIRNTEDTLSNIDIQIRLLANEEEMAKLADSPQDFAELTVLLENSERVLTTGGDMGDLDRLDQDDFASEWLNEQFRR
jgi:hypothetical protein